MYYIIVNPASKSGKGKRIWEKVEQELQRRTISFQVFFSDSATSIADYVGSLTYTHAEKRRRWKTIQLQSGSVDKWEPLRMIVLGGDGTLNEVINAIADFQDILLGYIPGGSSNDFARGMHLSKDPIEILEEILLEKRIRNCDVGTLRYLRSHASKTEYKTEEVTGERRFVVSAGIGFDAAVCEEAMVSTFKKILNKVRIGKLTYLIIGIKQILKSKKVSCTLFLDNTKQISLKFALFVTCMNLPYEGGGFQFCPKANAADGLLDICLVGDIGKLNFLRALPYAFFGTHFRFQGIEYQQARTIKVMVSEPLWVHTDGEVSRKADAIEIRCDAKILQLLG